ncbi:hypothetical protein [Streptomyces bacillaris]|uniref:hypothetical protein n=1 Tax=Streptomyces bacillaris TaxID=68179 RepID=UPI0037FB8113
MSKPDDDHQWPSADDDDHKWTSRARQPRPGIFLPRLLVQKVPSGALDELLTEQGFSIERIAEMSNPAEVLVVLKAGQELNAAAEAIREKFQAARVEIIGS